MPSVWPWTLRQCLVNVGRQERRRKGTTSLGPQRTDSHTMTRQLAGKPVCQGSFHHEGWRGLGSRKVARRAWSWTVTVVSRTLER